MFWLLAFVTFSYKMVPCCLGLDNFCRDIEFMLGVKVGAYWRLCWGFVTPVFLIGILIYRLATLEPITYNGKAYPEIAYGECTKILFTLLIGLNFYYIITSYTKQGAKSK